jgi:hypothetical protein
LCSKQPFLLVELEQTLPRVIPDGLITNFAANVIPQLIAALGIFNQLAVLPNVAGANSAVTTDYRWQSLPTVLGLAVPHKGDRLVHAVDFKRITKL